MFFAQFNHSSWLPLYKLPITADATEQNFNRGVLRVVLGNPLVAETMLQYDLTAGKSFSFSFVLTYIVNSLFLFPIKYASTRC
jgi:hypothetical protein